MPSEFPKTLYVTKDGGKDEDEYFVPWEEKDASGIDGDSVAVYKLVEVKTLKITNELV